MSTINNDLRDIEPKKLTPPGGAASFGSSVAVHGCTVVVGAPHAGGPYSILSETAYVFVRSGTRGATSGH